MKIRFFGGAGEVGRSSILLSGDSDIMLDYGMMLGGSKIEYPVSMPDIDGLVLSHAHMDHSGNVPALFNEMNIPVFGTEPTRELSILLLNDTLKIARNERVPANFHKRQLNQFDRSFIDIEYGNTARIAGSEITMYDAGHICGSAITKVEGIDQKGKSVVYVGDFKLSPQALHKGAEVVEGDVLIIESTYALRDHPPRNEVEERFISDVRTVLDNGGNALVPAFAVGRSQELLAILHKNGLSDVTYLDGMAKKATEIVLKNKRFIYNQSVLAEAAESATWVDDMPTRDEALSKPSVILTTAGMLSGGPVCSYIRNLNKDSRVFLTGYQVEGTNGRSLMDRGVMNIRGKQVRIDTQVSYYDFSAHAGTDDLYEYARRSSPHTVICVHGDSKSTAALAEHFKEEGFDSYAPKVGDMIDV